MAKRLPALKIFFATEMWERYGFYVVQSLLALYLLERFHLQDSVTYTIVGSFTALTYISPYIGGLLADQYLGHKRAVLWGAVILALSYLCMSLFHHLSATMLTLAGVSMGTGLLKPNISSLLGYQFKAGEIGRDSAFTLFYVGISIGIILGTTLPIHLKEWFGWDASFFSGTIGLIIAFFTFLFGSRYYKLPDNAADRLCDLVNKCKSVGVVIVFIFIAYWIIQSALFADIVFILIAAASVATVLWCAAKESTYQRKRTIAFLLLCIISVMFWALYFQMFLSLTLFIHRAVEQKVLGIIFPAPYYVTVESIGLVFFGPILAWLWIKLHQHNKKITTPAKFTWALGFVLLAYLLIVFSARYGHLSDGRVLPWLLIVAYLFISLGELLLSPVGLSMATKLVRQEVVGVMMGIFFVSLGLGGKLAGWLAQKSDIPANLVNIKSIEVDYYHAFLFYAKLAAGALIISLILMPTIKKLIQTDMPPAS